MMSAPLEGLKVLDLGTFISAPFCGTLLAEFGADVVKVEMPGSGDSLRTLGEQVDDYGLLWLQESRNKRAITCDLRMPDGQRILRDLVRRGYDVVLENFRPGTLERWHLGYDDLQAVNQRVILTRVSGYGQTGPSASKPMFGRIAQAVGGLTYLCGFPDRPPANPGSATIADYVAGLFAAFGVMVAREHRLVHGEGQVIDVALTEGILRILDNLAIVHGATGKIRERTGTATPLAAPHNHYPTQDGGWVAIACTNNRLFGRLTQQMGRPELATEEKFARERDRVANREELDEMVSAWTMTLDRSDILRRLDDAEVPCGAIRSILDIFSDPQTISRESVMSFDHDVLANLRMPAVVPRLSRSPGRVTATGPSLGRDNEVVLGGELGYTTQQLAELRAGRVI